MIIETPCPPEEDFKTGRLLTEWFECPEPPTDEELRKLACEHVGVGEVPKGPLTPEQRRTVAQINLFVANRKNRSFGSGMTKQEMSVRLNEASKFVSHQKFLPEDVRERTGLELNPLWMMETLVRSGVLTPKEQVAALRELATYTHSKAPTINHSTTTHMSPEDWLIELAKDEYEVIESPKKKERIANGAGGRFEWKKQKEAERIGALSRYQVSELDQLEAEVEDIDFDDARREA